MYIPHRGRWRDWLTVEGDGRDGSLVARICPNRRSRSRTFHLAKFRPVQRAENPPAYELWASTRTEPSPWSGPALSS